jgi:hypothetical protein
LENMKKRENLEELDIDWIIILKRHVNKLFVIGGLLTSLG